MKKLFFALLLLAPAALAQTLDEAEGSTASSVEASADDGPITWVDESHAYATTKAQQLTEWMDDFFGDPEYDAEKAESFLRLEFVNKWEPDEGNDFKVRVRGKVQLPKISRRLDLVFAGDGDDELDEDERRSEDSVGLQYELGKQQARSNRFDLTVGYSSGNLRPGVRYRNQGAIGEFSNYRFTQRVQYETDEGVHATSQFNLSRKLASDDELHWSSRAIYGEKSDGVEWRSSLALRQRLQQHSRRPIAMRYFFAVHGVTSPDAYTKNYQVGLEFRRKIYRDFLFFEFEPAYNFIRSEFEDQRHSSWSVMMRLEVALERDLLRVRKNSDDD